MALAEILESQFRADVRFRGAAYLKDGRVSITHVTADDVYAVVLDGAEHSIHLHRNEGNLEFHCSSVAGTKRASTTKYVWATILAVDEEGYLTGVPRPGHIPAFVPETSPELTEDWDDDFGEEAYFPPIDFQPKKRNTKTKSGTTATLEHAARKQEWQEKLHAIREQIQVRDLVTETKSSSCEITYQIDVPESWKTGHLVLQIVECQRRSTGGWGKIKPLKLKASGLESLPDADDRAILAHLLGGIQDRSAGVKPAGNPLNQHVPNRFRVPHSLSEILLPRMCSTGRLRMLFEGDKMSEPLTWGTTEPWQLGLSMETTKDFDETSTSWQIVPRLMREEESLPLQAADLLVEGGWAIMGTVVEPLEDFSVFEWVKAHRNHDLPRFNEAEGQMVVHELMTLPSLPRLDLPDQWKLEERFIEPKPKIRLFTPSMKRGVITKDRIEADVEFQYGDLVVRGSSHSWALSLQGEQACIVRDVKKEKKYWDQLQDLGIQRISDRGGNKRDLQVPLRELTGILRALFDSGWEILSDDKPFRQPGEVTFRVESGIDWFDLTGNVEYGSLQVSVPSLLSALARGDRTIQLSDGSIGFIPEEWKDRFGVLLSLAETDGESALRFSSSQAALVDALLATQDNVNYDEQFVAWQKKLAEFNGVEPVTEPKSFQGELRDYQREGLGWLTFLEEFQFGGCLADDMGLGKTVQVLAFLSQRYESKSKHDPSLIVVPKSLLFNWRREIERFTPHLKSLEYSGSERAELRDQFQKYDIILVTYATLRRDIVALKDQQFDCVILDEAQAIKNPGSQVAKATRLLRGKQRLALSGTPIENHLGDMWSIFEFLNPGLLGRSSVFKSLSNETDTNRLTAAVAGGLKPFVLRRTKEKVAKDLPERVEETLYCEFSEAEQKTYNELRDYYRQSIFSSVEEKGLGKTKMHVLEALLRLRQAACHPGLLDQSRTGESSAKMDVLIEHLKELKEEGHKTLVFSQFTSLLAIVKEHLEKNNLPYVYLDGSTKDRDAVVQSFQDDKEIPIFLISLKAGGLGLNLTAAGYVFLLDPWWNPAVEAQAIDRAHRLGQTKNVFAYRLIARGTIEEKIAELQTNKRKLADAILSENSRLLKNLTQEDLQMLFT